MRSLGFERIFAENLQITANGLPIDVRYHQCGQMILLQQGSILGRTSG